MHRNLSRSLRASLLLGGLWATVAVAQSTGPLHPLDGVTTAEYWAAYDVLQQAGCERGKTIASFWVAICWGEEHGKGTISFLQ